MHIAMHGIPPTRLVVQVVYRYAAVGRPAELRHQVSHPVARPLWGDRLAGKVRIIPSHVASGGACTAAYSLRIHPVTTRAIRCYGLLAGVSRCRKAAGRAVLRDPTEHRQGAHRLRTNLLVSGHLG